MGSAFLAQPIFLLFLNNCRDEIELQVLDSSRTKGRMTQTQCLLEMEDISPPVGEAGTSGIGQYLLHPYSCLV